MSGRLARISIGLLLVLSLFLAASCGKAEEGEDQPTLEEAQAQAAEAIEAAEILMQGAAPGTDLSDARELLDQARDLYGRATTVEGFIGQEGSVLALVEEANRRIRQAMEAERL